VIGHDDGRTLRSGGSRIIVSPQKIADRHVSIMRPRRKAHLGHLEDPCLGRRDDDPHPLRQEASAQHSLPPNGASAASFNPY
jgi:hypothetical protein